jgi:DNA modification methylase
MTSNTLFFGDNLDILKHSIADASVDLVYLDPPFNSNRSYNLLFKDEKGVQAPSQIRAFEDTWSWASASELCFDTISDPNTPDSVRVMLETLYKLLGGSEMMAYLAMMTPRLMQLHRVLKPTGSLYLHCDPTASHYLKIVMDTIFRPENFRNEITWQRTNAHNDTKKYGNNADIILYYVKTKQFVWNTQYQPYSDNHLMKKFSYTDENGRRYAKADLTAAKLGGDVSYEWKGVKPYSGRYWAYSRENMQRFHDDGHLVYSPSGMPRLKKYLDEMPGIPLQSVWTDIDPLNSQAAERLGYPTQKPLALLRRIIEASSNPGDVVLDPFCGCGTAIDAAQELGRTWIGIDLTHLSIALIKNRLFGRYGLHQRVDYAVQGEPRDIGSARALAENDREQFEYWSLSLVEARPWEGRQQKGADKGRDGLLIFQDDTSGRVRRGVVSVKSGRNISSRDIRDLRGTIEREKAELGIFVTLEKPTKDMVKEALEAGMYEVPFTGEHVRRIQIFTIAELLDGKRVDLPRVRNVVTLPKATRATIVKPNQASLLDNIPAKSEAR